MMRLVCHAYERNELLPMFTFELKKSQPNFWSVYRSSTEVNIGKFPSELGIYRRLPNMPKVSDLQTYKTAFEFRLQI